VHYHLVQHQWEGEGGVQLDVVEPGAGPSCTSLQQGEVLAQLPVPSTDLCAASSQMIREIARGTAGAQRGGKPVPAVATVIAKAQLVYQVRPSSEDTDRSARTAEGGPPAPSSVLGHPASAGACWALAVWRHLLWKCLGWAMFLWDPMRAVWPLRVLPFGRGGCLG
jgi:hypothetical protein